MKLGNPNLARRRSGVRAGKGGAPLREAIARNADRHAQNSTPPGADIRPSDATSLRDASDAQPRTARRH